jgi:divalent metal cation (Fe/Co/Zn/Cd) transporter
MNEIQPEKHAAGTVDPGNVREMRQAGSPQDREYVDLRRFIFWVLASLVPLTAVTVTVGILSDSLTIVSLALDSGTSLVLHSFNMVSIVVILRRNRFNFPYGTGKLENFSGFLYALLVVPMSLIILVSAANRYLHPPAGIDFGLAQLPLALSTIRAGVLLAWASRLCARYPHHSPMTRSYLVNLKLTMIRNLSIIAGLLFGLWMLSSGRFRAALTIDLVIGVSVALYMLSCAARLLAANFRSLIDLPLPEADQYTILNALVKDFDTYEGVGNIYSQLSGSVRFVQIELYFGEATTVAEIEELRARIEQRLSEHFGKLVFHLIPLIGKAGTVGCEAAGAE